MKLWHFAALLAVLGIAYVLIKRPQPTTVISPGNTSTSNQLLSFGTSLAALAGRLTSTSGPTKVAPPSTQPIVNEGTYLSSDTPTEIQGNTLVNTDTGQAVTYGTD
jgi:hypothetical protein